jgi:hypothetical protein
MFAFHNLFNSHHTFIGLLQANNHLLMKLDDIIPDFAVKNEIK